MYINGQLAAGPATSSGIINDWDGGDLAEIGKGSNIPGSTTFSHTPFTGDVALFNYYGNRLLDEQQIIKSYLETAGTRAPFAITDITYAQAQSQLNITFLSEPGRIYAIDSSGDFTNWLELNDFIPGEGERTTYTVEQVNPISPGLRTQTYRVRLIE